MKVLALALALCAFAAAVSGEATVHADGRVTLRLQAPDAEKVLLNLEGRPPAPMSAGEQGLWSVTVEPLAPGFYPYYFVVDGVPRSDPSSALTKPVATGGGVSLLHVPGPPALAWEDNDVPRGAVHRHVYRSEAIGEERAYYVYTPPGYDAGEGAYPTLYLLHGAYDDARAWTTVGRADVILDNLIARGEARPMLVVFPLGYGFADVSQRYHEVVGNVFRLRQTFDVFARTLVEEIVPRVEKDYRVIADREARAIAGQSMGGAQALYVGLDHRDRFAWIGSFGAALIILFDGFDKAFPDLGAADDGPPLRLLWLACGSDDPLIAINGQYRQWLEAKSVDAAWVELEGGHDWDVWRRSLIELAPLLFTPPSTDAPRGAQSRSSVPRRIVWPP